MEMLESGLVRTLLLYMAQTSAIPYVNDVYVQRVTVRASPIRCHLNFLSHDHSFIQQLENVHVFYHAAGARLTP